MVEFYQDEAGEWRFRIIGDNGEIIAVSSEGYASEWNAKRGAEAVRAIMARCAHFV